MEEELSRLTTESRNERSKQIDKMDTIEILRQINAEDQKVAQAVKEVLPDIEVAVEYVCDSFSRGGRLIYMGAGTSGRLGVLDAVECPPTFSTPPEQVVGLMAGGEKAFVKAVEGAEDNEKLGEEDLKAVGLTEKDTVIGIAASGRTPYVIGALRYARSIGAHTVALSSNPDARISQVAGHAIEVIVGPEVLTGSTRMKAGTAHKMILNMISTTAMIRMGKVYENLMVDVKISNYKLQKRAINIIRTITGLSDREAEDLLRRARNEVKTAIVMHLSETGYEEAKGLLEKSNGHVREAITLGIRSR
jgi:N-acetylmuramic acid 6-phosphate etherase